MRKVQAAALIALILLSACKRTSEATYGVDTTLNDSPEPRASPTVELLDQGTSDYAPSYGSDDQAPLASESMEEADSQAATDDVESFDKSRPALAGSSADTWISTDDYPPSALRAEEEGTTAITWDINEQGRVENCHVTSSSGSDALDRAACAAITRRGRYSPALDQDGNPVRSTSSRRVTWKIPSS